MLLIKVLFITKYLYFNDSNFLCYMKILTMWYSHVIRLVKSGRQFVFKILYIQDIVYSRYCIYTLSGSLGTINLTRFLYQICRTGKPDENDYFYAQDIKNPVKYL